MNELRNFILVFALSILVLLGFEYFRHKQVQTASPVAVQEKQAQAAIPTPVPDKKVDRAQAILSSKRIPIKTPQLHGSINLKGGLIDDITLINYHETPDPSSNEIALLGPHQSKTAYFCELGWTGQDLSLPTVTWKAHGECLTPLTPVTLTYTTDSGLTFERRFTVDDQFMIQVKDTVTNKGSVAVTLKPYAQIVREGTQQTSGYYILHEGPIGVLNSKLQELNYQKLTDKGPVEETSTGGWIGITDKYWLVALIPPQDASFQSWFRGKMHEGEPIYTSGFSGAALEIRPNQPLDYTYNMFVGAKKLRLLDQYEEKLGFQKFDLAVDFGWFYFLTKPLFYLLEFLNKLLGNLGYAILILTILFKGAMYPLASKSFRSMSQMKRLQPKIEQLKEKYPDDKVKMQQAMMELYRKENINPLSGCLPMIVQAPIFFCLYKVLFVTIEMRHAPFLWWIKDLSAPDPTNIFTLFGLIPWTLPAFFNVGLWPIIMGLTMFLQQKLNPQPTDPAQAKAFMFMPIMLTFFLAQFPAGLVIYWAWMNILGILQQSVMMYHHRQEK